MTPDLLISRASPQVEADQSRETSAASTNVLCVGRVSGCARETLVVVYTSKLMVLLISSDEKGPIRDSQGVGRWIGG